MKAIFCTAVIFSIFVQNVSLAEDQSDEEEIGVCGPVPNHGQMMSVLKPMSHLVVCTVNQIMDHGILLRDIQRVIERICLVFDKCVPNGKLSSNKPDTREALCLKEKLLSADDQGPDGVINASTVEPVFGCITQPLLPLQKQSLWSVLHWMLQMTNM